MSGSQSPRLEVDNISTKELHKNTSGSPNSLVSTKAFLSLINSKQQKLRLARLSILTSGWSPYFSGCTVLQSCSIPLPRALSNELWPSTLRNSGPFKFSGVLSHMIQAQNQRLFTPLLWSRWKAPTGIDKHAAGVQKLAKSGALFVWRVFFLQPFAGWCGAVHGGD